MWVEKICRLCGQISENVHSVFHIDEKNDCFEIKLKKCLPLTITEQDLKPKEVCEHCFKTINDIYTFILICEATDFEFEKILYENSSKWYQKEDVTTLEELNKNTETVLEVNEFYETERRFDKDDKYYEPLKTTIPDSHNYYQTILEPTIEQLNTEQITDERNNFVELPQTVEENVNVSEQTLNERLIVPVIENQIEQPPLVEEKEITNTINTTNTTNIIIRTKPFSCTICLKQFMRRANVQTHMAVQHSNIRPYQCEHCDRSFSTRRELRVHTQLHTEQHRCPHCSRVFPARGKLERHVRTHTGERPFTCEVCNKAFADKRNLDAHISIHTDYRPFKCDKCSKKFRSKSHLTEHSRVHTLETPFTCDSCGQRFKWRANLLLHLRAHTGQLYNCSVCQQKYTRSTQLKKHMESCHKKNLTNLNVNDSL